MPKASRRRQRSHRDDPPAEKSIGLYHVVYPHEGFDEAATALFELVRGTEQRSPGSVESSTWTSTVTAMTRAAMTSKCTNCRPTSCWIS